MVGDRVFSIYDGIVSRVKVSASGYGNALYIEHPNGLVSVYGHLESFIPSIADLVLSEQYKCQDFEIDFSPGEDTIAIAGGQQIGLMGSTGYSFGPHLHLEIREKKSNKMLNPLAYFKVNDQTKPIIKRIKIHHLDHRYQGYNSEIIELSANDIDTLEIDAWRIGLGIEAFDPHNRGLNRNGIYRFELHLDDTLFYAFKMDELAVQEAGFYNAHLDMEAKRMDGRSFHTCYRKPGNKAKFYYGSHQTGVIPLFRDRLQKVKIRVSDFAGNQSEWSVVVRRSKEVTPPNYPTFQYVLNYQEENNLQLGRLHVTIPKGSLVENCYASLSSAEDSTYPHHIYKVYRPETPLFKNIEIALINPPLVESFKSKTLFASISDGKIKMLASHWKEDTLISTSSTFGSFTLAIDTIAPTIKVLQVERTRDQQVLRFKLQDQPKYQGSAAKLKYTVYVDNQWHLASYDLKSGQVECKLLRKNFEKGEHRLEMIVSDFVGNQTSYDYRFNFN